LYQRYVSLIAPSHPCSVGFICDVNGVAASEPEAVLDASRIAAENNCGRVSVDSPASPSSEDLCDRTLSSVESTAADVVSDGDLKAAQCSNVNAVGGRAEFDNSFRSVATSFTDAATGYRSAFYGNFNVGVFDSFFSIVEDASKTGFELDSDSSDAKRVNLMKGRFVHLS
jgi:hypothetical protein